MESAEQKTTGKRRKTAFITVYVLVNVCRFLLALTFLFSAFTKANDPVGFIIKLKDYAAAIGFTYLPESQEALDTAASNTPTPTENADTNKNEEDGHTEMDILPEP